MGETRPQWVREEFIVALDLYLRRGINQTGEQDPEVVATSELLRSMPFNRHARGSRYRSPGAVYLRMANFAKLDTGKGMSHGGKRCEAIWRELGKKPEETRRLAVKLWKEYVDSPGGKRKD